MRTRTSQLLLAIALLGACALIGAAAQSYPTKPVRILTSAAGGPYDTVMRGFSVPLAEALGQSVVIENRTGGNYVPLGESCARAAPDGYTLCTADAYTTSLNPHVYSKLPYNSLRDFAPIIHFGYLYSAVIVHPSVPANSIQELLALVKAKPDALAFGTSGVATNSSIYVEYLRKNAGISFLNVPYKTFVQALNAVVAGEVQVSLYALGPSMAMARGGRVRALAVTGDRHSQFAPSLPTLGEAGVDINVSNWGGIVAPAGTPREIVMRLNAEFRRLIADPVVKQKYLDGQTFEQAPPSGGTPEQFAAFLKEEDEKFGRLAKFLGLRLD